MNTYCRAIFPFSWDVVIFPAITTYLPHYCSKSRTLFQHKCSNLVDRTRATSGLHFVHYCFVYFIACWRFDVKIFYRFLKLFNPWWYKLWRVSAHDMTSFHKMFPTIIFTKRRQNCFVCFEILFAIFPDILFNAVNMVVSNYLLLLFSI